MNEQFEKYWQERVIVPILTNLDAWEIKCLKSEAIVAFEEAQPHWQPIETAPKDGNIILVFDSGFHSTFWLTMQKCWSYSEFSEPTHWQPLPEPPKTNSPETTEAD